MDVPLGICGIPFGRLVEGGVKVQEVREEPSCGNFAGELVQIVVRILGEIADASLLLPDLDGEDCG